MSSCFNYKTLLVKNVIITTTHNQANSLVTYQVTTFPIRPLGGFLTPNSLDTKWNGYSVSMGNSMKTGPGVPDWAMARAFLTVGTISRIVLMDAQNLHSGLKRDIWSMSCSAPLPCFKRAARTHTRTHTHTHTHTHENGSQT